VQLRDVPVQGNLDELSAGEAIEYLAPPGLTAHGRLVVDPADPE